MGHSVGTVTVEPVWATAGEWGTWTVVFEVGAAGIAPGGGVRVQFPDSWHVGERQTAKPLQSSDPALPNYVSGRCSRPDAGLVTRVVGGVTEPTKVNRAGVDGREGRYIFVTEAIVGKAPLLPGDRIEIVYGDRSQQSPGLLASLWVDGPEPLGVAVDAAGDRNWVILSGRDCPAIDVRPGLVAELVLVTPSTLRVGDGAELRVVLLDEFGNLCTDADTEVILAASPMLTGEAETVVRPRGGRAAMPIRANAAGVFRLRGRTKSGLTAVSNPIEITVEEPARRVWWGDLHSHAGHSFDGVGRHPFGYARDVACLDFYALTDHCERWPENAWEWLRSEVQAWYEPGQFTTILGYEATFVAPWGHHNVYFRGLDGPVLGDNAGCLPDLWEFLQGHDALTVPHHTGVRFGGAEGNVPGGAGPNPDWSFHDPELRRLIEIYSGHGHSEAYDPEHPLSYENAGYDLSTSADGPHYAQDAWLCGHHLGVLASSDDHHGQPGRGEYGLAAVRAPTLTREDVFDALRDRHVYGTTGARILLDFTVNNVAMGGRVVWDGQPLRISLSVHGTDVVTEVELVVGDLTAGGFQVAQLWKPEVDDFSTTTVVSDPPVPGLYYLRLRQSNCYRGRIPMAWSSPVSIDLPLTQSSRR